MRNGIYLLTIIAMVVATILAAGCFAPTQTHNETSHVASTSPAATATSSSATTASTTVMPSPSAALSPTPSPRPTVWGKSATSIQFVEQPQVSKSKGTALGIDVLASGIRICGHGAITATIGTVSSGGLGGCYYTAYLDISNLNPGTYDITVKFTGDSVYLPSQLKSQITITA
jgi:outer membrane murein-binding lipoprotein Lpp